MKNMMMDRREFLKNLGMLSTGAVLLSSPWLSVFADVKETAKEKCRLAVIGPGSRGRFLMSFLLQNPNVEIVAFHDIYQKSIEEALKMVPNAKVYADYRQLLEDKSIDAVLIATPLNCHYQIAMDAFDAGKHVFCEKTIGYNMDQCYRMYQKHRETGLIFFTGQQRLFDPRYIKAMEMVHAGMFGEINAIRTFWYRNGDWRRPCPSPELEKQINWRLYKASSKGLMTELACHQLQIGSWALQKLPEKVCGHGAITYWKDGREVYDNVHCMYVFDDGVKMTFDSVIFAAQHFDGWQFLQTEFIKGCFGGFAKCQLLLMRCCKGTRVARSTIRSEHILRFQIIDDVRLQYLDLRHARFRRTNRRHQIVGAHRCRFCLRCQIIVIHEAMF